MATLSRRSNAATGGAGAREECVRAVEWVAALEPEAKAWTAAMKEWLRPAWFWCAQKNGRALSPAEVV